MRWTFPVREYLKCQDIGPSLPAAPQQGTDHTSGRGLHRLCTAGRGGAGPQKEAVFSPVLPVLFLSTQQEGTGPVRTLSQVMPGLSAPCQVSRSLRAPCLVPLLQAPSRRSRPPSRCSRPRWQRGLAWCCRPVQPQHPATEKCPSSLAPPHRKMECCPMPSYCKHQRSQQIPLWF